MAAKVYIEEGMEMAKEVLADDLLVEESTIVEGWAGVEGVTFLQALVMIIDGERNERMASRSLYDSVCGGYRWEYVGENGEDKVTVAADLSQCHTAIVTVHNQLLREEANRLAKETEDRHFGHPSEHDNPVSTPHY